MDDKLKGVAIVILLLIMLAFFASRSQAQDGCVILPCEDAEYCPDLWVYVSGEWQIVSSTVPISCYVQVQSNVEDVTIELPSNGIWTGQFATIYRTDTGSEIYCTDADGNGTLGLVVDEATLSETEFDCGTFYILPTGEYQLVTIDGLVIVTDNYWFSGAYYVTGQN